jgi:hypothetical protein
MTKHAARLVLFPGEVIKPLVLVAETVSEATRPTGGFTLALSAVIRSPSHDKDSLPVSASFPNIGLPCSRLLVVPLPGFYFEAVSFSAV